MFPDPEDGRTVSELAQRFDYKPEQLVRFIQESLADFRDLQSTSGAEVQLWFLSAAPQFSFYIFDQLAIVALYTHRRQRIPVPTLVCDRGGWLYDYVRKEFDAMVETDGFARQAT